MKRHWKNWLQDAFILKSNNSSVINANIPDPIDVQKINETVLIESNKHADVMTPEALIQIDFEHYMVHKGGSFFHRGFSTLTGDGATRRYILFTPQNTAFAHLSYILDSQQNETEFRLLEGVNVVGLGTEVTTYNRCRPRCATVLAHTKIYHTPDTPTGGTLIDSFRLGAARQRGGSVSSTEEIILKQNTPFMFEIINRAAGSTIINVKFQWYEIIPTGAGND